MLANAEEQKYIYIYVVHAARHTWRLKREWLRL